jgi:cell division protein ZapA
VSNPKVVGVKLLNKEFQINCPVGAEEQLREVADYLDQKMREIRSAGRVIGTERIAVMAALNITHELLAFRRQKETYIQTVTEHIECLQNKIDEALMKSLGE